MYSHYTHDRSSKNTWVAISPSLLWERQTVCNWEVQPDWIAPSWDATASFVDSWQEKVENGHSLFLLLFSAVACSMFRIRAHTLQPDFIRGLTFLFGSIMCCCLTCASILLVRRFKYYLIDFHDDLSPILVEFLNFDINQQLCNYENDQPMSLRTLVPHQSVLTMSNNRENKLTLGSRRDPVYLS
jgi:hypothetical protein